MRGRVEFWNFIPPDELDELLKLFQRVTNKTIAISRTLGIEGRMLLNPDDDFDPVKELNEQFDGIPTEPEKLRVEYNSLVATYPDLAAKLCGFPLKVYSGKASPKPETRAVFFYRIPRPEPNHVETDAGETRWSEAAGTILWACYDLEGNRILTEPGAVAALIRSEPDTPRHCMLDRAELSSLRAKVERRLINEYLRPLNAPVGINPILKAWMELS